MWIAARCAEQAPLFACPSLVVVGVIFFVSATVYLRWTGVPGPRNALTIRNAKYPLAVPTWRQFKSNVPPEGAWSVWRLAMAVCLVGFLLIVRVAWDYRSAGMELCLEVGSEPM